MLYITTHGFPVVSYILIVLIIYLRFRVCPGHLVIFSPWMFLRCGTVRWTGQFHGILHLIDRKLFCCIVFLSPIFKTVSEYILIHLLNEQYLGSYYETNCICTLSTVSLCLLSSILLIYIARPNTVVSFYVLLLLHSVMTLWNYTLFISIFQVLLLFLRCKPPSVLSTFSPVPTARLLIHNKHPQKE